MKSELTEEEKKLMTVVRGEWINHTTLQMEEDCLITCQTVYNPFAGVFEKSKD